MSFKKIYDKVAKAELKEDCGADPAGLQVHLTEVLLPAAQVERLIRLRVLHESLDHSRYVLNDVALVLTEAEAP